MAYFTGDGLPWPAPVTLRSQDSTLKGGPEVLRSYAQQQPSDVRDGEGG